MMAGRSRAGTTGLGTDVDVSHQRRRSGWSGTGNSRRTREELRRLWSSESVTCSWAMSTTLTGCGDADTELIRETASATGF